MVKNYKNLPLTTGIYIFWDKAKTPIYIGKAINLRRRVASYFDLNLEPKTAQMIKNADKLTFVRVNSEIESLLLEAKLINLYKPKYNIVLKDDKRPLFIKITTDKFPRVITSRKDGDFGPFPNSQNVKFVLKSIRKIFPYAEHTVGKKPCFYSHLGLCNPCPNTIKDNDLEFKIYQNNIKNIKKLLSGKFKQVRNNLNLKMNKLSKLERYEEAKNVRDKIEKLDYITTTRIKSEAYLENPNLIDDIRHKELEILKKILNLKSLHRIECFDIAHLQGIGTAASMVVAINGEMEKSEYKHFKIKQTKGQSDYDSMREVSMRRIKHLKDWGFPDLIIVDGGLGQVKIFDKTFEKEKIPVIGIAKNPDRLVFSDGRKIKLQGLTLQLVARIRDEAHRFARRLHHRLLLKLMLP